MMKIKMMILTSLAALTLAACSSTPMDAQNKAKVVPVMPETSTHTHAENCKYYAVTHTHGAEMGGTDPATHNHGRGC